MSIHSLIRSGVPQGSILGPILFLLPLLLNNCHVDFFADDATAHTSNKNIEIINAELQSDFSIAVSWSKRNKLPIDYVKTTYMVLGAKKRINNEHHLVPKADNHTIDKVTKQSNKVAKIRNRYNQVPHLTQDTNGKVTNSQKTPQTRAKRSALSQQVTTKHI